MRSPAAGAHALLCLVAGWRVAVGVPSSLSRLQLQGDPFQYDTHIQLIRALAKLNDLDRIRHARQKFRAVFPLTEELWSEWIREEEGIASTPEAQKRVIDLYRLAVRDYLCELLCLLAGRRLLGVPAFAVGTAGVACPIG